MFIILVNGFLFLLTEIFNVFYGVYNIPAFLIRKRAVSKDKINEDVKILSFKTTNAFKTEKQ